MSKERELPRPPKKKKVPQRNGPETPLLSEEMEIAAAQGKLDQFLEERIPDNEYAKALARMAAGMSGFYSPDSPSAEEEQNANAIPDKEIPDVPEAIMEAAGSGDLETMMTALAAEHERRTGQKIEVSTVSASSMETQVLDSIIKIASENNLSIDWLVTRALKLYVEEHRKTGKL